MISLAASTRIEPRYANELGQLSEFGVDLGLVRHDLRLLLLHLLGQCQDLVMFAVRTRRLRANGKQRQRYQ